MSPVYRAQYRWGICPKTHIRSPVPDHCSDIWPGHGIPQSRGQSLPYLGFLRQLRIGWPSARDGNGLCHSPLHYDPLNSRGPPPPSLLGDKAHKATLGLSMCWRRLTRRVLLIRQEFQYTHPDVVFKDTGCTPVVGTAFYAVTFLDGAGVNTPY